MPTTPQIADPSGWYGRTYGGGAPTATATPTANPMTPTVRPRATPGGIPPSFADTPGLFDNTGSLDDKVSRLLGFGANYADWLTGTEASRQQQSLDTTTRAAHLFDKPTFTDADIEKLMGGYVDSSARTYNANNDALRAQLGAAGVTGGGRAQAQAIQYQAQRMGSITDATRSLYETRVKQDAADRAARFNAQMAVANEQGKDPSVAGMDFLGAAGNLLLGSGAIDAEMQAAHENAKAQKKAGKMSAGGNIIGSALGLIH